MKTVIDEISGYQFTHGIGGYRAQRFDLTKPVISLIYAWEIMQSIGSNIPMVEWFSVQINHNDG
jgi:hypothetical protein